MPTWAIGKPCVQAAFASSLAFRISYTSMNAECVLKTSLHLYRTGCRAPCRWLSSHRGCSSRPSLVETRHGQAGGPPWELSASLPSSKIPARSKERRDVTSCLTLVTHERALFNCNGSSGKRSQSLSSSKKVFSTPCHGGGILFWTDITSFVNFIGFLFCVSLQKLLKYP